MVVSVIQIKHLLTELVRRIIPLWNKLRVRELKPLSLRPLTPQYKEEYHKTYVHHLLSALDDPSICNIALSGPYDVGKSSILKGFMSALETENKRYAVACVSLSTLGTDNLESQENIDCSGVESKNSRIQKEIVKQLLYRTHPRKLPASRFKRVYRTSYWRRLTASACVAAVLTYITLLIDLPAKLPPIVKTEWWDLLAKMGVIWLPLTLITHLAVRGFQGHIQLEKVSAGPATISLSSNGETYFDKFLDELMYFFEVTQTRIVVFEDIDRFDEPKIFEELRELNTLLNSAMQLKQNRNSLLRRAKMKERPIVFIYAAKDSIFDASYVAEPNSKIDVAGRDMAIEESERANRTKFFDLIVPVVPFITHYSARDLMKQELSDVLPEVSSKLINLVAKHVPDLRMVRSACNEYQVYAEKLITTDGLKLKADNLFAMMLYKNVHMRDFEQIRFGNSRLDAVYQTAIWVIDDNLRRLNDEYDRFEKQINAEQEAKRRANRLSGIIERIVETQGKQMESFTVEIDGQIYSQEEINTVNFWIAVSTMADGMSLLITDPNSSYSHDRFNPIQFTKSNLANFISSDFVYIPPRTLATERLARELRTISLKRNKFRRAVMSDLMKWRTVVPGKLIDGEEADFAKYVEYILGSKLASDLVLHGYIDRNFVLYAAIYQETSLSSSAMSFKIQHLDRGQMNATYSLQEADISDLLQGLTLSDIMQPGAYNVSILNYLLRTTDASEIPFLTSLVDSLLRDGEDEKKLLQEFLSSAGRLQADACDKLIAILSSKDYSIFNRIIGLHGSPDSQQYRFMDVALQSLKEDIEYDLSKFKGFIETSCDKLESLRPESPTQLDIEAVVSLFSRAGVKVPVLDSIRSDLRLGLINHCDYVINSDNLMTVTGSENISLDYLKERCPESYDYVLGNLDAYFKAVSDVHVHVSLLSGNTETGGVVSDLVKKDISSETLIAAIDHDVIRQLQLPVLNRVLDGTDDDVVMSLDELIRSECWPTLMRRSRVVGNATNVLAYIKVFGVDQDLAEMLLAKGRIDRDTSLADDDYLLVVRSILEADDELIPFECGVKLAASLERGRHVRLEDVVPTGGDYIGKLIAADLIDDDERAYERARSLGWDSQEHVVLCSKNFVEYMTPALIAEDVMKVINSRHIGNDVKRRIIEEPHAYLSYTSSSDLGVICSYAVSVPDLILSDAALVYFATCGGESEDVISLLARMLDHLDDESVVSVIRAVGGVYSELLHPGKMLKVPIQIGVDAVLDRLRSVGAVTSFKTARNGKKIDVWRRRK